MSIGQAIQVATIEDGTQINFSVAGGRLYRVGTDLATTEDVTPSGITISSSARVYLTPYSNRLAVNDGVNTPWIASDLLNSPVTATKIDYESDGSAWKAFGPAVVWGGALWWLVRERNGEGTAAGTPEKRTARVAWSEPDDPLTGYHQTDFDNEWDIIQNGASPINALWGTNLALEYFREQSIGYLTGIVGPDIKTTATHDAIDEATGTRAPAALIAYSDRVFFIDVEGRVMMLKTGAGITPIWEQHRRVVDEAQTRFPDITARTACAALVPELDLYLVAIWSPDPTNASIVFPTTMYVFRAESGVYCGEWTIGPFEGDKVAIHAMGTLVGANGEPRLVVLGKPSLAAANAPAGLYILDALDDEQWKDDDELPDILYTTSRVGYSAGKVINTHQATVIVNTIPETPVTMDTTPFSITLAPPSLTLAQGGTAQLSAIVRNAAGQVLTGVAVTWSSDSTTDATVGVTGIVTRGAGTGDAHIRAQAGSLVSAPTTVSLLTVAVPDTTPASIVIAPTTISLAQGETRQLAAVVRNAAGKVLVGVPVTWASDSPLVISVSATGIVTGTAVAGVALITATAGLITSNAATVTGVGATIPVLPDAIVLTPAALALTVGQTRQMSTVVKDAQGNTMAGLVPDAWHSSDITLATVSPTGLVTALAVGAVTITASLGAVHSNACALAVSAIAAVGGALADIIAFAGPMIAAADMTALGLDWYETNFRVNADAQWDAYGADWKGGNSIAGYERAMIYYVAYARTGRAEYLDRANQLAVNYRDTYLAREDVNYGPSPHWSQMESLLLHYLVTGEAASKDAILQVNRNHFLVFWPNIDNLGKDWLECRVQMRVMMAMWMDEKASGAPFDSTSIYPTGEFSGHSLDTLIPRVLALQNADGFWGFPLSTCGGSLNYQQGMLADFLTRIYDQRPAAYNAAILTAMTNLANYLWSTQWRGAADPADPSFNYISLECPNTGSPTPAPDLNGLILPLFGWLFARTADASWITKGDQILAGMQGASVYLYRQFSESYIYSYQYVGYREPGLAL